MNVQQRAHVIGAILALGGVTVACSPDAPPPPPPPTLTASPPETELERQERAFASAEQSYRAFRAEFDRLRQRGYSGPPTAEMRKYAGGPYLKAFARFLKEDAGTRSVGAVRIVRLEPGRFTPTQLTLRACEDGRRTKSYDDKGNYVASGAAAELVLRARPAGPRWIIWDGDDREVESCSRA